MSVEIVGASLEASLLASLVKDLRGFRRAAAVAREDLAKSQKDKVSESVNPNELFWANLSVSFTKYAAEAEEKMRELISQDPPPGFNSQS